MQLRFSLKTLLIALFVCSIAVFGGVQAYDRIQFQSEKDETSSAVFYRRIDDPQAIAISSAIESLSYRNQGDTVFAFLGIWKQSNDRFVLFADWICRKSNANAIRIKLADGTTHDIKLDEIDHGVGWYYQQAFFVDELPFPPNAEISSLCRFDDWR